VTLTLWVVVAALTAYQIAPASVLPVVRADLGVGATAASWLVSALILAMALFGVPAGVVLDRVDRRWVLVGATVLATATTVAAWWTGAAGDYRAVLAVRFLSGVAIVTVWTASLALVGAAVDPEASATAVGVLTTAVPAGFAVSQFVGPPLSAVVGWAGSFAVYGGVALLGLLGFVVAVRGVDVEAGDGDGDGTDTDGPPTWTEVRTVVGSRAVLTVAVLAFAAFSLNLLMNSWLPTFVVDRFTLPLWLSGLVAGVFPAVGVLSRASSGPVSKRFFDDRRRPVVFLSFVVATPAVAAVAVVGRAAVLLALLAVSGFFIQLGLALLFTYVQELVAANVVGTAVAVLNAVGFLGAFSAPVVAGALLEATGGFVAAFAYAGALATLGVVAAWVAPEPGADGRRTVGAGADD
jgi:predicted MFS family arabinose efflux permease